MHKKILAAALATFFSTGALASQVTINGAIDSYVAVNHMGGDGWESAISSGGVNASHVGLKGTEDLSNGTQVFFNLDTAYLSDSGEKSASGNGRAWSREADVGVRGRFGSLSFGRQYTPHFLTFLFYDPTGLSLGSSFSPFFMAGPNSTCGDYGDLVRTDNSISYVLPTSFGLTNFFFVALGEHNGSSTRGNFYNYAAKYDRGAFSAMGSYMYQTVAEGIPGSSKAGDRYDVHWLNLAASYDLGFTKPVIEFEKKWGTPSAGSNSFWMIQVGTSTPAFGGNWMVSASYLKNQSRKEANAWSVGTKFNYNLLKRTRIYVGVEATFNGDNSGYGIEAGPDSSLHFHYDAANAIAGTGYATDYLGKNVQQVFMGISHEF